MQSTAVRSIVAISVTVGLDQLTKYLAGIQGIVVVNPGAAFSLGHGASQLVLGASAFALLGVFFWWPTAPRDDKVLLAFILGAGGSNLADRVTLGGVRDFIALGWFPSFNVADLILVVAIAWLLVLTLFRSPHHPNS